MFVEYLIYFTLKILLKTFESRRKSLDEIVEESKIFEKLKKNNPKKYLLEKGLAIQRLEFILSKKSDNLINVFRLDEEVENDFELTILRAFLNCK